ncbi:MAG: dTMP kinase [Alphaproteobacteria bacterium]|nr:dTMP kinase [Alphaproteobacteria bacterium]MCB9792807.1 dTMP kinase [Alphaproteobacteria bacterium]
MATRGVFIAVEGLDGSGGTTQVRLLAEALRAQGRAVHVTAEPSTGPVGKLIRKALADKDMLGDGVLPYLFAADRKDHLEREVQPQLEAGAVVISDRYVASSLAYQSLAAPLGVVSELNARFLAADLTLFLDLPPDQCLQRIEARGLARDRFEQLDILQEIDAAYGAALALLSQRGDRIAHVSASGSPLEVHQRVMQEVAACT